MFSGPSKSRWILGELESKTLVLMVVVLALMEMVVLALREMLALDWMTMVVLDWMETLNQRRRSMRQ